MLITKASTWNQTRKCLRPTRSGSVLTISGTANTRPDGYELEFWLMAERELKAERRAKLHDETATGADA
jgi:hypothetical protein